MDRRPNVQSENVLYYGAKSRFCWRRLILISLLAVAAGAAIWVVRGTNIVDRVHFLIVQRRCLNYTPRLDELAYVYGPGSPQPAGMRTATGGAQRDVTWTGETPACLTELSRHVSKLFLSNYPLLFLGKLNAPDGSPKLVALSGNLMRNDLRLWFLDYEIIEPGTIRSEPALVYGLKAPVIGGGQRPVTVKSLEVYRGQVDPADPNHALIPFIADQQEGVIDCRLQRRPGENDLDVEVTVTFPLVNH